mgnify:CR=1 FL=1
MPELPEVEIIRRYLDDALRGRVIESVTILLPRQLKHPDPEDFRVLVRGQRIERVARRGKYLLIHLQEGGHLVFHLRMTGSLVYEPQGTAVETGHTRMVFSLAGGGALRFSDIRTFGCVYGFAAGEEIAVPGLQSLGPEPLSDDFTSSYLAAAIKGRKQPVKSFLLDQRHIAGLGNIYADEALFLARIDPRRAAGSRERAGVQAPGRSRPEGPARWPQRRRHDLPRLPQRRGRIRPPPGAPLCLPSRGQTVPSLWQACREDHRRRQGHAFLCTLPAVRHPFPKGSPGRECVLCGGTFIIFLQLPATIILSIV